MYILYLISRNHYIELIYFYNILKQEEKEEEEGGYSIQIFFDTWGKKTEKHFRIFD